MDGYKLIVKKDKNDSGYGDSDFVFEAEHYLISLMPSNLSSLQEKLSSFLEKEYYACIDSYYLDRLINGCCIESSVYQFELQSVNYVIL